MMLEWLGAKHGAEALQRDAQRVQDAVDAVIAEGTALTADLGGNASTQSCAEAIARKVLAT
jgi:3-isopropylmalate dehydrogenase